MSKMNVVSSVFNIGMLESMSDDSIQEILQSWVGFCSCTNSLLSGAGDLSFSSEFISHVKSLTKYGLDSLVRDHFLRSLEETFEKNGASPFWQHFDAYSNVADFENDKLPIDDNGIQQVLCKSLEDISLEKQYQEKCLLILIHALQSSKDDLSDGRHTSDAERVHLFSKYQLIVTSVLMATLPRHFCEILHWYFKARLEELSTIMDGEFENENGFCDEDDMDLDDKSKLCYRASEVDLGESCNQRKILKNNMLVKNIGKVVRDLRSLGFTSMAEDAYASAIFLLLKAKVHDLAGDDYRSSVLEPIKGWIQGWLGLLEKCLHCLTLPDPILNGCYELVSLVVTCDH